MRGLSKPKKLHSTLPAAAIAVCLVAVGMLAVEASGGQESSYGRGYVPPPFRRAAVVPREPDRALSLPLRFDWREQGKVTSVKNQGASCGACYAFASLADFESKMLIGGGNLFDFSENNVKECEWYGEHGIWPSGCDGGNYWRVANLLSQKGTVLESCDPYVAYNSTCKTTCPYVKTLLEWRIISFETIPSRDVLKHYIQTYGPIYGAMNAGHGDAWYAEFNAYDGSYTLHYTGPSGRFQINHAVLVIGWDDTLSHAGGQGAWIAKNSWGNKWGGSCGYGSEKGYFTIAYGSAGVGSFASYLHEWQDYDASSILLYHDEAGCNAFAGNTGSKTSWGMCKFVFGYAASVERVELWTADFLTDLDIYIYDDFNGISLSNELASELDIPSDHPGYHSVELTSPVTVNSGEDIYVVAKITNETYVMSLPADVDGPKDSQQCFTSVTGTAWSELTDADLGIRIRVRADDEPPGPVSSFTAEGSDTTVTLKWSNPSDSDFSHTLVRYSVSDYPLNPYDGDPVENGEEGRFENPPATVDSFVHEGLENDVTYYYTAFAGDGMPNYSAGIEAAAMPEDSVPPGPLADFTAIPSDVSVKLRWTGPDDIDFRGLLIRYSTTTYPQAADDGLAVENGSDGMFTGAPATVDSFIHTGLSNDTAYYYSAFAYDEMLNHSAYVTAEATPIDLTPPEISISLFQNPFITNHLDVYAIASEAIIDTSLTVTVGDEEVSMQVSASEKNVYCGDYDIYTSGNLGIKACARDLSLNRGCSERNFTSSRVLAAAGGTAVSTDGRLKAVIPRGALARDVYVLVSGPIDLSAATQPTYEVSPASLEFGDYVELSIVYDDTVGSPEHLSIGRFDGGSVLAIESYVDTEGRRIVSYVERLGRYGITWREDVVSEPYGEGGLRVYQNSPNPFEHSTAIVYEIPRPSWIGIEVISVDGRLVRSLWSGLVTPGRHRIRWDGTDSIGRRVASGVYLYRISGDMGSLTRKMVMLR